MTRFCGHCKKEVEPALDAVHGGTQICSICGSPSKGCDSMLPPGTMVGGFSIESEIGRGGMGVVYKARQLNLERLVALKVLSDELSRDGDFVQRFFREARSAASLSHPSIVQAYDAGVTPNGIYYFAMELIDGETLDGRIIRKGQFHVKEALEIAMRVAEALNYAWERQKLSHGDIKPDNIILDKHGGGAKLADLGLAKSMHDSSPEHELMATPLYAPPEIIEGKTDVPSFKSDMYSFGATLYHMVAGEPPFPGDNPNEVLDKHLKETHMPLPEKNREVGATLSALVDSLLEKDPSKRPAGWGDIVKSLGKARDSEHKIFRVGATHAASQHIQRQSSTQNREEVAPGGGGKRRIVMLAAIAVLVLLAAAGTAAYFLLPKLKEGKDKASVAAPSKTQLQDSEWTALKEKIDSMHPKEALPMVEAFFKKWQPNVKGDALERMKHLKAFVRQENESAAFLKLVDSALNSTDEKAMKGKGSNEIQKACSRLDGLKREVKAKPFLASSFPKETLSVMDKRLKDLNESLKAKLTEEADARKAELERQDKERKEEARQRREEQRQREAKRLAQNMAIEEFYEMLSGSIKDGTLKSSASELEEKAGAWIEKHARQAPPELTSATRILEKAGKLVVSRHLSGLLSSNESILKGASIPHSSASGFVVDSADSEAIKLVNDDGIAKIGKKICWSQLPPATMSTIFKEHLLDSPANFKSLSKQDREAALSFCLLNCDTAAMERALKASSMKGGERKAWSDCAMILAEASKEIEAVLLWKSLQASISAKDFTKAASALIDMKERFKDSDTYKRHSQEIGSLLEEYSSLCPDYAASDALKRARDALSSGDAGRALSSASSACAKYAFLQKLSKNVKTSLLNTRGKAFNTFKDSSDVKSPSDNKSPFSSWDITPGDSWVYKQMLMGNGLLKQGSPVFTPFVVDADFEAGLWEGTKGDMKNFDGLPFVPRILSGPLKAWLPSLLYGVGIQATRFQSPLQPDIAKALKDSISSYDHADEARLSATLMAAKYLLMCRMDKEALAVVESYLSDSLDPSRNSGLQCLRLLALVQNPSSPEGKIKNAVEKLMPINNPAMEFASWMAVFEIDAFSDEKIVAISSGGKLPSPSISLALDTLAKAYFLEKAPNMNIEAFLNALDSSIPGNVESAEAWETLTLFRLTCASTLAEMKNVTDSAMKDERLCSLSMYPSLLALRASLPVAGKDSSKEFALAFFDAYSAGSPIFADSELRFKELMENGSAEEMVSSLSNSGFHKAAFWAAVSSMMLNFEDKSFHERICGKLSSTHLTWEEKSFLKMLPLKTVK